mgnify:CR=1 FL=1
MSIYPPAPNDANTFLPPSPVIPMALEIVAITRANPMVITAVLATDQVNNYVVGQLIRLFIPADYGMQQANGLQLQITAINGLNFSVNVNSTLFDAFTSPTGNQQPASFAPAGSRNLYNTLEVPFHSEGNLGN